MTESQWEIVKEILLLRQLNISGNTRPKPKISASKLLAVHTVQRRRFFLSFSVYGFVFWKHLIGGAIKESKYRSVEEKREQVNAVFYFVKTGCQWRNLPKDFPKRKTVYSFYRRTCLNGTWDKIQRALVKKVRLASGRKEEPTYALIDSQSVKTVSANEKRGYDGEKKRKDASGT